MCAESNGLRDGYGLALASVPPLRRNWQVGSFPPGHHRLVDDTDATITLTSNGTAPADGVTITLGNKVYTAKTALTPTEGEVLIGGTAAAFLDNLKAAVNHTGRPDTDYSYAEAHTQLTATTNSDTTQVFVASVGAYTGAGGNGLTVSDTLTWSVATLAGGLDARSSTR